jgi:acyl-CoA synthetase (NDP forming)
MLREHDIPIFSDPGRGVRSLGALVKYVQRRERYLKNQSRDQSRDRQGAGPTRPTSEATKARNIIAKARSENRTALTEGEGKQILELYGIPTPRRELADTNEAAARVAQAIGFPVVMKIASADITHKTEAGGVRLGVKDINEAVRVYDEIIASAKAYNPKAKLEGVLIEEMVTDAVQVIVGAKRDPRFGQAILFGMGGIYVELFRDAALRIAPLDEDEALVMIKETKAYKLLTGFRGDKQRDVAALAKVLTAVSRLVQDFKDDIAELDINPVLVLPEGNGVRAVDALVVLK